MDALGTCLLALLPEVSWATGALASHRVTRAMVFTVTLLGAVDTVHPQWTGQCALLPFPTWPAAALASLMGAPEGVLAATLELTVLAVPVVGAVF